MNLTERAPKARREICNKSDSETPGSGNLKTLRRRGIMGH